MVDHAHVESVQGSWRWPSTPGELGVRVVANGSKQIVWACGLCDYRSTSIPHHLIESYAGLYGRCIVRGCESDLVELNHFAPQAIFGDEADDWPTGYLCVTHHREWGERVTPQLNRPRKTA